jgi:DNA-binding transcriptional LysR family regulator
MALSDLKIEDFALFLAVVESPSIAEAAAHLATTSSTVSRRLKKLEDSLGVRLLDRTTRTQQITSAGELFYQQCQVMLGQLETISGQIRDQQDSAEGHIRVYAPAELFVYFVQALTERFTQRYPRLRVEFLSGAVKPRLLQDNIDVVVHVDEPPDSSCVARRITTAQTHFYASPSFLQRYGTPASPAELGQFDCVVEIDHARSPRPWRFRDGGDVRTVQPRYRYSSDSITLCRDLAQQDQGITMLPEFSAVDSVAAGKLVRLFNDNCAVTHNVYAVYASRRFVPAKITTFVDFLADNLPARI